MRVSDQFDVGDRRILSPGVTSSVYWMIIIVILRGGPPVPVSLERTEIEILQPSYKGVSGAFSLAFPHTTPSLVHWQYLGPGNMMNLDYETARGKERELRAYREVDSRHQGGLGFPELDHCTNFRLSIITTGIKVEQSQSRYVH